MSKYVTIRLANGEIIETTILRFFKMLADESAFANVLWQLSTEGTIMVELKSGLATVVRDGCGPVNTGISTLTEFLADARITFTVPARLHVRASSAMDARNLALDYIEGRQPAPPDFGIILKSDDVESVLGNLEIGNYQGVESIEISEVSPRRIAPKQLSLEHST